MRATRGALRLGANDAASMREQAMQLGDQGYLVGVATRPLRISANRPTVIFLNAGVIHRVGPHRMHVNLARRLACDGFTSLRLDLSGIGDSRQVLGAPTFRESAVADTRVAMDHLAAEGGDGRFVIFGLCSGADNALATAAVDDRVVG